MARDKIGSNMETADCQRWLNEWISQYCVDPNGTTEELRAQRPLSEARIDVRAVDGKPGWFEAVAYLRPHFQMETLTTSMRLVAFLRQPGESRASVDLMALAALNGAWFAGGVLCRMVWA